VVGHEEALWPAVARGPAGGTVAGRVNLSGSGRGGPVLAPVASPLAYFAQRRARLRTAVGKRLEARRRALIVHALPDATYRSPVVVEVVVYTRDAVVEHDEGLLVWRRRRLAPVLLDHVKRAGSLPGSDVAKHPLAHRIEVHA